MSSSIFATPSFFESPPNTSTISNPPLLLDDFNLTIITTNITHNDSYSGLYPEVGDKAFWFLSILPLPLVAVLGNILVILSVYKERSLQTVTNYFIVSLAFADLLVAAVVMPFALYVLVNGNWELSDTLCDFYIAVDVTCSTASIFNLVAISIDRYIAVTQPIKYSKHKNGTRVWLTIAVVWLVSAAIGSPIVLGLNTSPERTPNLCVFYNADFIIYSSLSSFYIPCIAMIFLYYKIFKAIHERARRSKLRAQPGAKHSGVSGSTTNDDQNTSSQKPQANKDNGHKLRVVIDKDYVTTNTASDDDDEEDEEDTFDEGSSSRTPGAMTGLLNAFMTETIRIEIPVNGNTDSGYGTSHMELETTTTGKDDPVTKRVDLRKKKSLFNLRHNKGSRKKRERASAKKERKATKTLAIVLGMFLICWVPFFTCNILDAICIKLDNNTWRPGMAVFLITTWLGYINSCVNPVIYTIFNMEFRKAFKKLLEDIWPC